MEPSQEATDHPLMSSLPGACLLLFIVIQFCKNPAVISSKCKCELRRKTPYGNLGIQHGRAVQGNLNCPVSANQSAPRLDFEVFLTMELFL